MSKFAHLAIIHVGLPLRRG